MSKYADLADLFPASNGGDPAAAGQEGSERLEELLDGDPQDQPDDDDLLGLSLEDRIERKLLTTEQILDLPPPEWLIDNYLVKNSLAVLYGPSGCGKTFLALDWALHVAAGSYWHDNRVDGGSVLYIAAEGVAGIGKRVKTWMGHNRIHNLDRIHWLPEAVNVAIPETVAALIEVAKRLQPSLIVVDTLARSIVGVDENSAKDMGEVVSYLDQLRKATGACVLVVHHTGKDTSAGARGSSALLGAVDTAIEVDAADPQMTVKVKKQKDAAAVDPVRLTRIEVGESCVLVPSSKVAGGDGNAEYQKLLVVARAAVRAAKELYEETGEPPSLRLLEQAMKVKAQRETRRAGIELAVAKGALAEETGPRNARLFRFVKELDPPDD